MATSVTEIVILNKGGNSVVGHSKASVRARTNIVRHFYIILSNYISLYVLPGPHLSMSHRHSRYYMFNSGDFPESISPTFMTGSYPPTHSSVSETIHRVNYRITSP